MQYDFLNNTPKCRYELSDDLSKSLFGFKSRLSPVVNYINIVDGVTFESILDVINTHQLNMSFDIGQGEMRFEGWYLDENFTIPFESLPESNGIKLYIKYVPVVD